MYERLPDKNTDTLEQTPDTCQKKRGNSVLIMI